MLRIFVLLLSLLLVSCATTTESGSDIKFYYLQLHYTAGNTENWTQEDVDNFINAIENGDLKVTFWHSNNVGNVFLDSSKGLILGYSTMQGCNTNFVTYWAKVKDSVYCPLLEKIELNYINELIDQANETKAKEIAKEMELVAINNQRRIAQQIKQQELQFANYIAPYKAQCEAFGYTNENLVAKCVQDFVFADFAAQQMANNLEQLRKREDQIRFNNAIGQLGQDLTELSRRGIKTVDPTTNGRTQICNFKAFSGAIIKGDCKELTISSGGVTYWRE